MSMFRRQDRGFVLVMAIAILAIAATAMARLANRSLTIIRQGTIAQRDLERRWEMTTARIAFLQRSEELLQAAEQQQRLAGQGWPYASRLEFHYRLGGREYRVLIADEDAKANLNSIYARRPEQLFGLLAQAAVRSGVPIRLLPSPPPTQPFKSWGQVLDLTRLHPEDDPLSRIGPLVSKWTCWGGGKLRLRRASRETIQTTLAEALTGPEIEDIIDRLAVSDGDLENALQGVDLTRRKILQLKSLVTDSSQAYSLWIQQVGNEHASTLMILDPADRTSPEILVFDW